MEDNEYHPEFEPSKASKIIKNVFKYAFFALIIFIYGFFILRFCTSEPDTKIIWTPEALQAKQELGDSFKVYTQEQHIFIDEYKNVPVADGSDRTMRYGYNISIFDIMYFPATKQLQVTVRYNKSIMEDLMDEYGVDTIDGEPFLYTLLLEDGTRISTYRYTATSTNRYYFRYLIFDNVDLNTYELVDYNEENSAVVDEDGKILAHETTSDGGNILYDTDEETGMEKVYKINYVYLDTYFMGDVNFEEAPISCLLVYERDIKFKEVNWKKAKENTSVLIPSPAFIQKD
ncbi:MAG: hypothetical protein IKT65_06675 [Clostridia bacterium]|nr:hypothetical protein [Clostridia bacterium]